MPKATKPKKSAPQKPYVLALKFNPEERALLDAMVKHRGIRASPLLKSYLKEDANRLGIVIPERPR